LFFVLFQTCTSTHLPYVNRRGSNTKTAKSEQRPSVDFARGGRREFRMVRTLFCWLTHSGQSGSPHHHHHLLRPQFAHLTFNGFGAAGLDTSGANGSLAISRYTSNRRTSKTWQWPRARKEDAPSAWPCSRLPVHGWSVRSDRISSCADRASGTPVKITVTSCWGWTSAACPASIRYIRCTTFRCENPIAD